MKTVDMFRIALKSFLNKEITQSRVADDLKIPRPLMSDFLKEKRNFSEDRKEVISTYFGKTYFEMLEVGKKILEGEGSEVVAIDPAVRILFAAEKKAGTKLNSNQREKVIEIIRAELKKNEDSETESMVNIIKAFNG